MGANRGICDDTSDRIGRLTNTIRIRKPTNSFAISLVNPAAFLRRIRRGILPQSAKFCTVLTKFTISKSIPGHELPRNNLFPLTSTDYRDANNTWFTCHRQKNICKFDEFCQINCATEKVIPTQMTRSRRNWPRHSFVIQARFLSRRFAAANSLFAILSPARTALIDSMISARSRCEGTLSVQEDILSAFPVSRSRLYGRIERLIARNLSATRARYATNGNANWTNL